MIVEGSLRIKYHNESYGLLVKAVLKKGVYYFFVSDNKMGKALMAGETLELAYTDSFSTTKNNCLNTFKKISAEIISAIENMLLENKQIWFYRKSG